MDAVLMGTKAIQRSSELEILPARQLFRKLAIICGHSKRKCVGQSADAGSSCARRKGSPIFSCSAIQTLSGCERNTSTTRGSNCLPEYLLISSRAAEMGSALRYGRSDIIAS